MFTVFFSVFSSDVTADGAKKTADAPCRSSDRLKKASLVADGVRMATRSSPRAATSNTGDPVDRQVNVKAVKRYHFVLLSLYPLYNHMAILLPLPLQFLHNKHGNYI